MLSLEEEFEQNEKFCEKKSTASFMDSRKEYINDIAFTIANIFCLTEFTLESEEYPLIITYLMDLADFIPSPEFKTWYYKYCQQVL